MGADDGCGQLGKESGEDKDTHPRLTGQAGTGKRIARPAWQIRPKCRTPRELQENPRESHVGQKASQQVLSAVMRQLVVGEQGVGHRCTCRWISSKALAGWRMSPIP